jgi:hypothetical protein
MIGEIALEGHTKRIPITLPNGALIQVEVTPHGSSREADVASIADMAEHTWEDVTRAIEGMAQWLWEMLEKVHPTKAAVEFGIEISLEPGKVMALLVQGSGKANLKTA